MTPRSPLWRSAGLSGFTLVETLAVVAILSALAALLFPALASAERRSLDTPCAANLHQIGVATELYMTDSDGRYPLVVNAFEREAPDFRMGRHKEDDPNRYWTAVQALQSYLSDQRVFACPLDSGLTMRGYSAYPRFSTHNCGTSYLFAELFDGQNESSWRDPAAGIWSCDGSPSWHAMNFDGYDYNTNRVTALFYDFHVGITHHNAPVFLE